MSYSRLIEESRDREKKMSSMDPPFPLKPLCFTVSPGTATTTEMSCLQASPCTKLFCRSKFRNDFKKLLLRRLQEFHGRFRIGLRNIFSSKFKTASSCSKLAKTVLKAMTAIITISLA